MSAPKKTKLIDDNYNNSDGSWVAPRWPSSVNARRMKENPEDRLCRRELFDMKCTDPRWGSDVPTLFSRLFNPIGASPSPMFFVDMPMSSEVKFVSLMEYMESQKKALLFFFADYDVVEFTVGEADAQRFQLGWDTIMDCASDSIVAQLFGTHKVVAIVPNAQFRKSLIEGCATVDEAMQKYLTSVHIHEINMIMHECIIDIVDELHEYMEKRIDKFSAVLTT